MAQLLELKAFMEQERPMPVEPQPPVVLAMVLADTVLVDVTTGKNTIQGTYQKLRARGLPIHAHGHRRLCGPNGRARRDDRAAPLGGSG